MTNKKSNQTGFSFIKAGVFAAIALGLTFTSAWAQPEVTFHGQFRVNYYVDSRTNTEDFMDGDARAHRLRFRPTWDVAFQDDVKLHIQFNIGHIKEEWGNHNLEQSGGPAFGLRHGFISAPLSDSITGIAGIVPVSDKFGDTLFSGDWDFNPIALVFLGKSGNIDWRFGTAKIVEGSENEKTGAAPQTDTQDDIDVLVLDVDSGAFGGSVYAFTGGKDNADLPKLSLTIYGVRWAGEFGSTKLNAFVMGSSFSTDVGNVINAAEKVEASGFAAKVEGKLPMGDNTVGLLAIYAQGDKKFGTSESAGSFITPMSLIGAHGYYGYTGKLNIQGPTDTGIDDPVNIDGGAYSNANLGRGLMTVQANVSISGSNKLSYYVAVGMFQSVDAPAGASKDIGTDIYVQGKYNIGSNLNLEFGADLASLGKGHHRSTDLAAEKSRSITTVFSRLQLEW